MSSHRLSTVVSYASGPYRMGQTRLLLSLAKLQIPCHAFYEEVSGHSGKYTPHSEIPYYFKAEMMCEAAKLADVILWCDASVVVNTDIGPICEIIEERGYFLPWSGWNNAEWCNDRSLAAFNFTRDQAANQDHVMGAVYGFRSSHPDGRMLLEEHHRHRNLFRGQHDNMARSESSDPRCHGHRHDQSVLSLIAHFHNLEIYHCPPAWIHYGSDSPVPALINIISGRDPRC